jgi:hypothetical protein
MRVRIGHIVHVDVQKIGRDRRLLPPRCCDVAVGGEPPAGATVRLEPALRA